MSSQSHLSAALAPLVFLCVAAVPAAAGGTGENALLVVDPTSSDALWAANHYRAARDIPACNVLYMDPSATNYQSFVDTNLEGLFGTLADRGIADHIDYIVVMPGTDYRLSASGLVSDSCASVNNFGIAGAYTMAFIPDEILAGATSSKVNMYSSHAQTIYPFDSETGWVYGAPGAGGGGKHYFLSSLLGYTGERGNTMAEILDMVDRSVAVDGTFPAGTFYFMHTTDTARSGPRHNLYPGVAADIIALGGNAQVLFADLPLGNHDCLGIMTGRATLDIDGADMTILPGAFADHLTSYAGHFDSSTQTKMSRWIAKGASGTSGAVEEPCNYPGKFPHATMHRSYFKGLSLGEAWYRSMAFLPFQNLLLGDPLTRPFTYLPVVDVPDLPGSPVTGTVFIHPTATATAPGAQIESIEVLVDGVTRRSGVSGEAIPLQTDILSDGWHEVRALAYDDTDVRAVGRWVGWMEVDNGGRSATAVAGSTAGDQGHLFHFDVSAQGTGFVELRLVHSGRVLATTTSNPGSLDVFGVNLGAGPAVVQLEALFDDGARVRGLPIALDVSETGSGSGTFTPVASDYHRMVLSEGSCVVELPAVFDDGLDSASFTVVTPPSQASVAAGAAGGYRMITPQLGATGTDTLVWRVTTPSGVSSDATVTIEYHDPAPPCSNPTLYCASNPNSTGFPAMMWYTGTTSIIENEFTVSVFNAPPQQFGLFFYGPDQIQLPFGDGFRCVGGGVYRLSPASLTDMFGILARQVDFNEDPAASGGGAIHPGSTWNFQFWYRDPAGPGGSGFNLTEGLSAEFCP